METYHTSDASVQQIGRLAFPNYSGRKFSVEAFRGPMSLSSYWDGGSREYFAIVNLSNNRVKAVPENGSMFSGKPFRVGRLPLNIAIVGHSIFCEKDMGLTVYVNPENLQKLLPPIAELSWAEKVVLAATCTYKSSYAGIKDYRFREARRQVGILSGQWDSAKQSCIDKGLLNRAGAITNDGRNAIGNASIYALSRQKPVAELA